MWRPASDRPASPPCPRTAAAGQSQPIAGPHSRDKRLCGFVKCWNLISLRRFLTWVQNRIGHYSAQSYTTNGTGCMSTRSKRPSDIQGSCRALLRLCAYVRRNGEMAACRRSLWSFRWGILWGHEANQGVPKCRGGGMRQRPLGLTVEHRGRGAPKWQGGCTRPLPLGLLVWLHMQHATAATAPFGKAPHGCAKRVRAVPRLYFPLDASRVSIYAQESVGSRTSTQTRTGRKQ